jgi:hypothetical protein
MVSGYNSSTPFTTPDPACAGQEGGTWDIASGPAAALRAAGESVFTAPVHKGNTPLPTPCAPGGGPLPGSNTEIDSFGDNDANGAALANFLAFLHHQYGVERVQLVAHSDGGNWSRSAITQGSPFAAVAVRSLTTLGTPYTGSMVADLGTELRNGKCAFTDRLEQDACEALYDVIEVLYDGMGPTAVEQLTHTYLENWNERQSIGSCPVTTIAGTGLDLPLLPLSFYNPSDGLVGKASALARSAFALPDLTNIPAPDIPGLVSGGTFPVVHAPSLSFINKANLLNTTAISGDVESIVSSTPAGPLCNVGTAPSARTATDKRSYELPLRTQVTASDDGEFGRTRVGDVVVARPDVQVSCGSNDIPAVPLLGDRRISLAVPDDCRKGLSVSGSPKAARRALLVRYHRTHSVAVDVRGDQVRVRLKGAAVKVRAKLDIAGSKRDVRLDDGRYADLPATAKRATVIVRATVRNGQPPLTAGAPIDLG